MDRVSELGGASGQPSPYPSVLQLPAWVQPLKTRRKLANVLGHCDGYCLCRANNRALAFAIKPKALGAGVLFYDGPRVPRQDGLGRALP
jgi:hypothetical protein